MNGFKAKKVVAKCTQTPTVKFTTSEVQTDFWQTRAYAFDIPKDLPELDNYTTGDESVQKIRTSRGQRVKKSKSPMGSRISEKYYQVVKSKDILKKKKRGEPQVLEIDNIGKINTDKESFKTYVPMGIDNLSYSNL